MGHRPAPGGAPAALKMGFDVGSSPCRVHSIGTVTDDWLTSGRDGKVLASVTGAIYLLSEQGELVWFAPEASPMHRRCMRVSSAMPHMAVGAAFQIRGRRLLVGGGDPLEFGYPPVWRPQILLKDETIAASALVPQVKAVYHRLAAREKASGWGVLVPAVLQVVEGHQEDAVKGDGIFQPAMVWPAIKEIVQACLVHDSSLVEKHAAGLVGLGAGLTPSGDDFLGGLFFSLSVLRSAFSAIGYLQSWNHLDFIRRSQSQTHVISYTLLEDHAEGHALEPLHRLAHALLTGQPVDRCLPFAKQLAGVGHSTGWDLLTGFLAGMSVTFRP